jgi:ring-1,2-phenylacetyl-CoA epoxidase subunit PaaC
VSRTSDVTTAADIAVVADGCLVASHRLTEWVSNAPTMEEDVAIGNIGLDLLGQARGLFSRLGNEDELAYFRDAPDWHNPVICELPNGDFGHTMLRQLMLDAWLARVWPALATTDNEVVRGVAEKAQKENAYHLRHSSAWVIRLGDGTAESHSRMLASLDELWPYAAEIAVDGWYAAVAAVLNDATMSVPPAPSPDSAPPSEPTAVHDSADTASPSPRFDHDTPSADGVSWSNRERGARKGQGGNAARGHTRYLDELLAEMQSLARAHPGATW